MMLNQSAPSADEPLAITALINSRCKEIGLTPAQLVKRAGYKNEAKGIRRLEGLFAGEIDSNNFLIQGLPAALNLPAEIIIQAVAETQGQLKQAEDCVAEEKEAQYRGAFKPHAIILTENIRPSPIVIAALLGDSKLLRIDFDLENDSGSYIQQALQKIPKGTIPAFGMPVGVVVNYSPDHAIRFDLEGMPLEFLGKAYHVGQPRLLMKGQAIPPGILRIG
jgi:hypothetical protein